MCFRRSGRLTVARQGPRTQARRLSDEPQCLDPASICLLPRELLVDIYRSRLAEVDPDIVSVVIIDPREPGSET
jgi:hypothetical protein